MTQHDHPELEKNIEEVAAAVMGPRRTEFAGGGRYEEAGLVHKVTENTAVTNEILRKLNNGGIKIKIPVPVWVAIIGLVSAVVVAVVDNVWGMPG